MANPYIGEIRMFGGNFAPAGWALCNGQLLAIAQNAALFSLLGATYGGNGSSTFGLPNLQGRVPVHPGTNSASGVSYVLGQTQGAESVTLLASNLPAHNHQLNCVPAGGNQASPANGFPAIESTGTSLNYSSGPASATMSPLAVANSGGNVPISVLQPYQCVNFIIALQGIYPSRN
jgi:microcystin-dependent protein